MGYSLGVYTVPAGEIQRVLGSKDQALYEAIVAQRKDDLAANDDFFADMEDEDDEDEAEPKTGCLGFLFRMAGKRRNLPTYDGPTFTGPYQTSEQLLHGLIFGETLDSRCGSKLAYVFEMLVEHLGTREDVGSLESMRSSSGWTGKVDQMLKKSGLPEALFSIESRLMGRGAPANVPVSDDFPYYGHLLQSEAAAAHAALDAARLNEIARAHEYGEVAVEATDAVTAWLTKCTQENRDLFGFYY